MKVALVSTYDVQGGAARAAYRLLRGLLSSGHSCSLLVRDKFCDDPAVRDLQLSQSHEARKWNRSVALIHKECIEKHRTPRSNTFFSLPEPGYDLSRDKQIQSADIIHLHWVTHLLSPAAIGCLPALGKPLVWTLHDQRAFTGGCHFSAGCRRFETGCVSCPQLELSDLGLVEACFAEAKRCIPENLTIVAPSRWMADCARASALFSRTRIEVIPNGIDTLTFRPGRAKARQQLNWAPETVVFIAGAEFGGEIRKGFGALLAALRQCMTVKTFREKVSAGKIRFFFFGRNAPAGDLPLESLGHIHSERELAQVYAGADAFLLPSSEDNFPNTMVESLCAGTPVIGFNAGGVPEAVESGMNGLLVPVGAIDRLALAIQSFAADADLRRRLSANCDDKLPEKYSLNRMAQAYLDLYASLGAPRATASTFAPLSELPLVPPGPTLAGLWPALRRRARRERLKRRWRSLVGLGVPNSR